MLILIMTPPTSTRKREENYNPNKHYHGTKSRKNKDWNRGRYFNNRSSINYPSHYSYAQFPPQWNVYNFEKGTNKRRSHCKKRPWKAPEPPKPSSPLRGSEEYTLKKIQEASDMIKKKLLMPSQTSENEERQQKSSEEISSAEQLQSNINSQRNQTNSESVKKSSDVNKHNGPASKPQYNIAEIHNKIVNHITNLSFGRKVNLICSTSSGYDSVIQRIQKQKRLEVSKAFRDMCSNQTVENTEFINSIIPDIGVKFEDLPLEVIQQISSTLDLDFETDEENSEVRIKKEAIEAHAENSEIRIKKEAIEASVAAETQNETFESEENLAIDIKREVFEDNFDFMLNESNSMVIDPVPQPSLEVSVSSVSTQTETSNVCKNTQTDFEQNIYRCEIDESHLSKVTSFDQALDSMFRIDNEISRLTKLRQSLFVNLKDKSSDDRRIVKKKKSPKKKTNNVPTRFKSELQFEEITEKVLVITIVDDILLAATEKGRLHYISLRNGSTVYINEITNVSITSLCLYTHQDDFHIFIGSLESNLRELDFHSKALVNCIQVSDSVQCMEMSWGFIFIGTCSGKLNRYSLKKRQIEFEENISDSSILVLKATKEGARKVLLVGTRHSPVCIRDALSGLHMRTMDGLISPTVYSMLLEKSLVYCGTTFHDILVFKFHDGELINKFTTNNSKGISCMKIVNNLLFAGCHNGNIYVYNVNSNKYVGLISGPGGVISMEIIGNIVIVGTLSCKFKSILIPDGMLRGSTESRV